MILKAIMIVFGCLFLGQVIVGLFDLPLPPSVVGLILLFLALQVGIVKLATIEKTCQSVNGLFGATCRTCLYFYHAISRHHSR